MTIIRRSIFQLSTLVLFMALAPPLSAQVTDCTGLPDGTACNDGNSCDGTDACAAGGCAGTMIVDNSVRVVRAAPGDPTAVISWNAAPGGTGSDVVRGLVSALPMNPLDIGETLLARNTGSINIQDSTVPPPGACFWYLVRGRTSCGGGPWGFQTTHGGASTQRQPREGCVVNVNASPRYYDNALALGDPGPTVTDLKTCLEWEKKSQPGETAIHDQLHEGNWYDATGSWISSVNAEVFAGRADWRVPSQTELMSIVEAGHAAPTINPIFGPTAPNIYWSSTSEDLDPSKAEGGDFGAAGMSIVPKLYGFPFVRAVRAGP